MPGPALSEQMHRLSGALALAHAETLQTDQSILLFQFITRGEPTRGDDLCAISPVIAEG